MNVYDSFSIAKPGGRGTFNLITRMGPGNEIQYGNRQLIYSNILYCHILYAKVSLIFVVIGILVCLLRASRKH